VLAWSLACCCSCIDRRRTAAACLRWASLRGGGGGCKVIRTPVLVGAAPALLLLRDTGPGAQQRSQRFEHSKIEGQNTWSTVDGNFLVRTGDDDCGVLHSCVVVHG
jgi:hypothetical protein